MLSFTSLLGFLCSIYLVFVITYLFWCEPSLSEMTSMERIREEVWFTLNPKNLVEGSSFVIFAYMYQPNVPIIYRELERANYTRMEKIVVRGSFGIVFVYILAAVFGSLTWIGNEDQLERLMSF